MNETEMSDVCGQISFSGNFDFDFGANYTVFGYGCRQDCSGPSTSNWSFGKTFKEVDSPCSGRTYYKSKETGNDSGTKYIETRKS